MPEDLARKAAAVLSLASIALTNGTPAERRALAMRCCRLAAEMREHVGPAPMARGGDRG